jgi:hypothetical protein
MAWERRGGGTYFYHSYRVGGRVRKAYLGKGPAATLAVDMIDERRETRAAERAWLREELVRLEPQERTMAALEAGCDVLVAATLTAAGYHRHDRGVWRRRRGPGRA